MNIKYDLIKDVSSMDSENIIRYTNDNYYFQDELGNLNENDIDDIFQKFLLSYFARVSSLCNNYKKEGNEFLKWLNKFGSEKFISIFDEVDFEKVNVKRLIKVLTNYDILMEQSIDEDDVDCIVDTLIDIPISFYSKMEEWNCFKVEKSLNVKQYFEPYESNEFNSLSINWIPAEMQVYLL